MQKLRVLSIFGTRPEAVKMAPVVQALSAHPQIEARLCVTAQHRQMLDQVLALFDIVPDIDLNLMRPNQSLAELNAAALSGLDAVLADVQPDWVLVQGDTTTAMSAALAAFYRQIRLGHVEAGLRTHDKYQPFPEEVNRRIISLAADLHFAPTAHSRDNLLAEGVPPERIVLSGNPVIDALQSILSCPPPAEVRQLLAQHGAGRRVVLVTAHRRENFGKPIEAICTALRRLAEHYAQSIQLFYPVHLNPNIQQPVYRLLGQVPNITLLPPLEYLPLVHLMRAAALVLTDSGGIQEEATALNIPTLVLREVTERPEGVQAGVLRLVGSQPQRILAEAMRLLDDPLAYQAMAQAENPFGDGHAAERIVSALLDYGLSARIERNAITRS